MRIIDADAHVEESVATWEHLDPAFYPRRPLPVTLPSDTAFHDFNAVWIIDHKLRQFAATPTTGEISRKKAISIGAQELTDVPARLADLDRFGIDHQVVYPSAWIGCLAEDPDLEAALATSYNTFMADRCAQAGGRLSYGLVVPFRRPEAAVAEVRRAHAAEHAASIFVRGMEWDLPVNHPSFEPIYAEAERHDLTIAVHVGFGSPTIRRLFEGMPRISPRELPIVPPRGKGLVSGLLVQFAFSSTMEAGLPDRFPGLRWVFLEIGAEWLPGAVTRLGDAAKATFRRCLDRGAFCVSGEPDEDLPYIASRFGNGILVAASDYPHADDFRHDRIYDSYAERARLSEALIEKLLSANPARLYGLDR